MGCSKECRKHGIDFVDAVRIFDGPIVEGPDEREDQEARMIAFGALGLLVIAVVYTWCGETCRIISARRATSHESKAYYEGQADD
ncbi:MAG: BrnT family toxin [Bryobacteraceae bacterium]